jgi:hypothetical protein
MMIRFVRQTFTCLSLLGIGLSFVYFQLNDPSRESSPIVGLTASNTYFGPVKQTPGNEQLIRVEILVRDSAEANGLQIVNVEFNNTTIPLKPRDVYGNRGNASFQMRPGTYQLTWAVNRDKFAWPRTVTHEETVTVDPRDLWLQISIEGDKASIR